MRAVSTWSIALVMWPNASLRNHGKHEVVTVNTSHQLLRVESDHISGPQKARYWCFKEGVEHHHVKGERREHIARRHGRTGEKQVKHIPFCGTRIWEFEFSDRVICRMRIK
jgi:hypothetical protein